jgi:hypothetical protein
MQIKVIAPFLILTTALLCTACSAPPAEVTTSTPPEVTLISTQEATLPPVVTTSTPTLATAFKITKIRYDAETPIADGKTYLEITIMNTGSQVDDIDGWKISLAHGDYLPFCFNASSTVNPGESMTLNLYTRNDETADDFWQDSSPNTAILQNPQGQPISSMNY